MKIMKPLTPWGLKVKCRMAERGVTGAEIARAIGLRSESYFSEILRGRRSGTKKNYKAKIDKFLGLDA